MTGSAGNRGSDHATRAPPVPGRRGVRLVPAADVVAATRTTDATVNRRHPRWDAGRARFATFAADLRPRHGQQVDPVDPKGALCRIECNGSAG